MCFRDLVSLLVEILMDTLDHYCIYQSFIYGYEVGWWIVEKLEMTR